MRQKIAALESRLAALTPRSVSQKPTLEDGDSIGDVLVYCSGNMAVMRKWNKPLDDDAISWLPGNLAKLLPEDVETAEDKGSAEWDALWEAGIKDGSISRCLYDIWRGLSAHVKTNLDTSRREEPR